MAQNLDLSTEEEIYLGELQSEGALVEISADKSQVTIDGVNRGSFEDTKAIFSGSWTKAVSAVSKANTAFSGILYNTVTCSAADEDLISVTATKMAMDAISGQTNIPIKFVNGQTLVIADDADLLSFLTVWLPFRKDNSIGYSFKDEL